MTYRLWANRLWLFFVALLFLAGSVQAQVNVFIGLNDQRLQGTSPDGQMLMYTPDPLQPGSSVSHWDTSASPNLLMEPAINPDLPFLGLDITPAQMQDIGWSLGTSSFNIIPQDAGFTDPRPFPGAPGNAATTLGEARTNTVNAVLSAWASNLASTVDIDVLVFWTPLSCTPGIGAVLAAAGTTTVFADGALPRQNTWYHAALAEALAGMDLTGVDGDIVVFINSDIDEECLGPGTGLYYGLDGNDPPNQIDLAPIVLHELAHGLGFANFTDENNGALLQGRPGIFDVFVRDTSTGKTWDEMNDAERVASAINPRKVVWEGANVNSAAAAALAPGVTELVVNSPASIAGTYEIGTAAFGPPLTSQGIRGELACAVDGQSPRLDACSPLIVDLSGKVALMERGTCAFTVKVANAQAAGAIAAVIVNDQGNTPNGLGGVDPSITIPAVSVGADDGNILFESACFTPPLLPSETRPIPTLSLPSLFLFCVALLGVIVRRHYYKRAKF